MSLTQSRGWQLTLTHPNTNRTINPDVLDNPEFLPSLNGLVEARIPVRRSQDLLDWPDGTTVSLSLNGTEQPLDETVDIQQESDRTIVVAEGGIELDNRVRTEFGEERRHIAAEDIITENTPYAADVDTPVFETQDDVLFQSADTTQEFEDLLEITPEDPIKFDSGVVESYQIAFTAEGEDFDQGQESAGTFETDPDFSDGDSAAMVASSDFAEWEFSLDYTIPADQFEFALRWSTQNTTDGVPTFTITLQHDNGNDYEIGRLDNGGFNFSLNWRKIISNPLSGTGYSGPDLTPGNYTVRFDVDQAAGALDDSGLFIDVVCPYDFRFDSSLEFDNTVNEPSGYLDGPGFYGVLDVEFIDAITPFVLTEATANLTIDDTSNDQAVALSPDRGATFVENTNSDTVTATGLETPQVRLRVTLSAYSPQGTQDQTPRLNYDTQTLDSFEIVADIRQESLLIDQTFDDSVSSVLNGIAGDEYVWSYRLENGTPTIAWTQPGQRTANSDPDIDANVSVSKSVKTWDAVTIKGSAQSASGEEFSGSTSFVDLVRDNIVPGSEAVRGTSNGTQFQRAIDYDMQYNPGEIRILDSGDMSGGTTYQIDYRYEVEGQFPEDYAGSGRELVETISGVVSDRQAQQLAYTILEIDPGVADPSWSADVLLPRGDELFDPLEALSLEQLELPTEATPLEVREPPQQTPQGIALQLGSRRGLEESLSAISNQLQNVSRRS